MSGLRRRSKKLLLAVGAAGLLAGPMASSVMAEAPAPAPAPAANAKKANIVILLGDDIGS